MMPLEWKKELPLPEISFGSQDDRSLNQPHDDALVITAEVERYDIKRVFLLDTGAAVNIIFPEAIRWNSHNSLHFMFMISFSFYNHSPL